MPDTINPAASDSGETWCPRCKQERIVSQVVLELDLPDAKGRFCLVCGYRMLAALLPRLERKP